MDESVSAGAPRGPAAAAFSRRPGNSPCKGSRETRPEVPLSTALPCASSSGLPSPSGWWNNSTRTGVSDGGAADGRLPLTVVCGLSSSPSSSLLLAES